MDDARLGTLSKHGDSWQLTFVRRLPHPPAKVWQAITEPEHMAAWFPHEIIGERRPGAALHFASTVDDGFEGEMLVFDPPDLMELLWGTDHLRFELVADAGGTVLTLTDTFNELGKAARDGAGWHECLDRLASSLAGEVLRPWGEGWSAVHPDYVESLGPEAATIGPPPGYEPATGQPA